MEAFEPDVLKKLRGSITDDGLLQRFIPVIMRTKALGFGSSYASEAAAYARVLTDATTLPENLLISLDADAKGVFANLKRLTHDLEVDDTLAKGFRGFAGKLDKVFAFLCGALLLGDVKGAVTSPTMAVVDGPTAWRANKIVRDFIIPHAYEVFGLTTNGASDIDQVRAVGSFILTDSRERLRYTAGDLTAGVRGLRHCTDLMFSMLSHLSLRGAGSSSKSQACAGSSAPMC